ncbi:TRNA ligase class II [Aphelenchoides fujianensis]|nr:TRNA ligase class II [Aphelenchoides fujianensis]
MRRNEDGEAECFDLLCPGVGELAGGSVREWEHERLLEAAASSAARLDWYLELRKAGYPRSSGFGLGVDRLVQLVLGLENVKDTLPFPRWYKHCQC